MRLSLGLPSPNLAAAWRGLTDTQRVVASALGSGGGVFTGAVTGGLHGSVTAQAIAYTGAMGLLAALPAAGAGRLATSAAARSAAAKAQAGLVDAAEAAAIVRAARSRNMAPAKWLVVGGAAVGSGAIGAGVAYRAAQTATIEGMAEQREQSRPAVKNQTEAG